MEPIAERVGLRRVGRAHQALHRLVAVSPWDEREVLRVAREYALELLERQAPSRRPSEAGVPLRLRSGSAAFRYPTASPHATPPRPSRTA